MFGITLIYPHSQSFRMEKGTLPLVGHTNKEMMLDWDGKLVVTVFLPKCNMDCAFCHSHELINPPEDAEYEGEGPTMALLKKHSDFYDGICVTGGEPTLHDLEPFFKRIKAMGMLVKLDTNGTNPTRIKKLVADGLVDYIAMDYKTVMDKYEEVARGNFSKEKVQESVDFLLSGAVSYEFRTTAVPGLHTREDLINLTKEIEGAPKWVLQRFRGISIDDEHFLREDNRWLLEHEAYPEGFLEEIIEEVKGNFDKVKLRG